MFPYRLHYFIFIFKQYFSDTYSDQFTFTAQISRLHLILKPFMLRRIKKDVEHELTDKVEVLVYCPLTIRQKLLYVGLKRKIHIEELLQNLGSQSQINSSLNTSLMNLVMQFRKVIHILQVVVAIIFRLLEGKDVS